MAKMVKIIKKKDEYSMEYEVGDVLKVDSTWYGGVTVLGKTGVPVSIDKDEYEEVQDISEPEKAEPTSIEEGLRPAGQGVSTEAFDHLKEIEDEVRGAVKDLLAVAGLEPGDALVVGCSSSEVANMRIGSFSSEEIGKCIAGAILDELKDTGVYMAAQCCEHLNRAIIVEKEYAKAQSQPGEHQAQCAITGEVSDIARIHSKIKGVAGGAATGGVLIGFNNPSENSYGNDQSYNSNISELAMRKYTEALNYILKQQAHKIVMDDITIAFWAMDGGDEHEMTFQEMLMSQSSRKTADEVNSMLKSLLSRGMKTRITTNELKELDEDLDGNIDFYIVGLKPNSSRISIKFLYRKKFLDMLWNLARFQDELQVSEEVRVVSLSWIKKECLSPKSNSEKISPALFTKLFEAAIYGTNYPYSLLETMVRRVKTDKFINATRAGVIKAYLTRNEKKEEWKVSLDRRNNNQAYLCGRLFAVLENIQNQAAGGGKLNSTIKDKYFASAAAKPASIFPTLIKLSQHHMKKLNDGSQIFHTKLVGEIMNMLENEFPKTLPLMEQGKFMIGYYQQVQDFFASKKPTEL